jgi:hypothetical protein
MPGALRKKRDLLGRRSRQVEQRFRLKSIQTTISQYTHHQHPGNGQNEADANEKITEAVAISPAEQIALAHEKQQAEPGKGRYSTYHVY